MSHKEIYPIGEIPPLGYIPRYMYAQAIRSERFGEPEKAIQIEKVQIPSIGSNDVLVYVMAAGVNYNNIWASLGKPLDLIKIHQKSGDESGVHIGGSDASGIVYAIGKNVTQVKVGDRVVLYGGCWDLEDPFILAGGEALLAPSVQMWGYEANWGGFAQFAKVQEHQCLPKATHLSWEEAAAPMVGGATAYRMLFGWPPHNVEKGDVVLVWGGAGGLGSMAIQIATASGAKVIAVVSNQEKFEYCMSLGAHACINRKEFDHWGPMPSWREKEAFQQWKKGVQAFGKKIWELLGEKKNPRLVFEHSGEDTYPTSAFVCASGGMVVTCGGTSGYHATVDLRYLWTRQKRLQGSHYASVEQAHAFNQMVIDQKIKPCLSQSFPFEEIGRAHQLMYENKHPVGNMCALVGAPDFGLCDIPK